jgi:hypothetical protein
MNEDIASQRVWTKVVGSAALGAAAMFVLDPDKGRRRRALARDKADWVVRRTSEVADAAARDFPRRIKSVGAQTARRLRGNDQPADAAPSVVDVDQRVEAHPTADRIPSLQGVPRREARSGARRSWTPAQRFGATMGGGFLAAYGLGRGGFSGLIALALGAGLVCRGLANAPLDELVDVTPNDADTTTANEAGAADRDLPIVQPEPTTPMRTPPTDAPTMAGTPGA